MQNLTGKRIVLGISEGIAAYKTIDLIRSLKNKGSKIRIVLTKSTKKFVTPLTLQTVSCYPILEDLFTLQNNDTMPHTTLVKWANLIVITPTTANLLTKLSIGLADNLLCSLCVAITDPIIIVLSINKQTYESTIKQLHLKLLRKREFLIWRPEYEKQVCENIGFGRMTDPKILTEYITHYCYKKNSLKNLNIIITEGPTHESLDPIRFFTNRSNSIKMGFSVAQAAVEKGTNITLIVGSVYSPTPNQVHRINITTALKIETEVMKNINKQQIFIGCAAASNYRISKYSFKKIKKNKNTLKITMIKHPDIISTVESLTRNRPYVVGFATATQKLQKNAPKKRLKKHLDLTCANNIKSLNQGFHNDYNTLHLFLRNKNSTHYLKNNIHTTTHYSNYHSL